MANTMLRKVDDTAASCGLLPKGAAMKKDQEAKTRPRRRWTRKKRPALVRVNMRLCQMRETMSQAGR